MKKNTFLYLNLLVLSLVMSASSIHAKKRQPARQRPPLSSEEQARRVNPQLTSATENGRWFVVSSDGWTSLHEALQACKTWNWGKQKAGDKAKAIIEDAQKQNGNINSTSSDGRKPLDVAKEYCPDLVDELHASYHLEFAE